MYYALLIYGAEGVFDRLSPEEQARVMKKHDELQSHLKARGAFGSTAQLMATSTAVSLRRHGDEVVVLDGPYAETKEQFLGLYLIKANNLEEAIAAGKLLPFDFWGAEIRPIQWLAGGPI